MFVFKSQPTATSASLLLHSLQSLIVSASLLILVLCSDDKIFSFNNKNGVKICSRDKAENGSRCRFWILNFEVPWNSWSQSKFLSNARISRNRWWKNGHKDMCVFMATQQIKWQGFWADVCQVLRPIFIYLFHSSVALQLVESQGRKFLQKS